MYIYMYIYIYIYTFYSGLSRNVRRHGPVSDPGIVGRDRGRDLGREFEEVTPGNFMTLICLYTNFSTYSVVKFISLLLALTYF